jgi:hypothetical protein
MVKGLSPAMASGDPQVDAMMASLDADGQHRRLTGTLAVVGVLGAGAAGLVPD